MEKDLNAKLLHINKDIDNLDIDADDKSFIYQVEKGIISSPNGHVLVIDEDDFQEYLCFKIPNNDQEGNIKFCISRKMIEYSGATAGRANEFPDYNSLIAYINKHRKAIEASLKEIEYYQAHKGEEKQEETSRTIIDVVREKVEKLPAPATKKARVYTILDRLAANEHTKIYTIRELEYEEYISVSDDRLVVTQRMLDYAGATIDRNEYILKSDKIIGYVEEHKDTIDKELTAKVRRR